MGLLPESGNKGDGTLRTNMLQSLSIILLVCLHMASYSSASRTAQNDEMGLLPESGNKGNGGNRGTVSQETCGECVAKHCSECTRTCQGIPHLCCWCLKDSPCDKCTNSRACACSQNVKDSSTWNR